MSLSDELSRLDRQAEAERERRKVEWAGVQPTNEEIRDAVIENIAFWYDDLPTPPEIWTAAWHDAVEKAAIRLGLHPRGVTP